MKNSLPLLQSFSALIYEAIEGNDLDDDQAEQLLNKLLDEGTNSLTDIFLESAPQMLKDDDEVIFGFEQRNYDRWKEPLDLLRVEWRICSEVGEAHSYEGPKGGDLKTFTALSHLHPRSLLVTSELICLLKGGFADAALARWRTLHEICVTMMFIAKYGDVAAEHYLLSQSFERVRALDQYLKYQKRAGLSDFTDDEIRAIRSQAQAAEEVLGYQIGRDFDWAAKALKRKRMFFFDLEEEVEMDHWRPRVKWASQQTHSGYIRPDKSLGMSEAREFMFQVGPSNSGLCDPIHMAAISQINATITFVMYPESNYDRLLLARVLMKICEQVGEAALNSAGKTSTDD